MMHERCHAAPVSRPRLRPPTISGSGQSASAATADDQPFREIGSEWIGYVRGCATAFDQVVEAQRADDRRACSVIARARIDSVNMIYRSATDMPHRHASCSFRSHEDPSDQRSYRPAAAEASGAMARTAAASRSARTRSTDARSDAHPAAGDRSAGAPDRTLKEDPWARSARTARVMAGSTI
jgi:hypothetical protein